MKNIEQILKDAGLEASEEQLKAVNTAVTENYRTIKDYNAQKKKQEDAEEALEMANKQLTDAQETLKSFEGVDMESVNKKLADYKERAEKAEKDAQAQILQRDQRDCLKAEFDRLEIASQRTRESLMRDIMGEDGLKWKDGAFQGLSDYLAKENEKDHFYLTEEEKKAKGAAAKRARFTQSDNQPEQEGAESGAKPVPLVW